VLMSEPIITIRSAELCPVWRFQAIATGNLDIPLPEPCSKKHCSYRHEPTQLEREFVTRRALKRKRRIERDRELHRKTVFPALPKSSNISLSRTYTRFQIFAKWIMATFPPPENGKIILDVAGGMGILSFYLLEQGYSSMVVDPRKSRLSRKLRKYGTKKGIPEPERLEVYFTDDFPLDHRTTLCQTSLIVGLHPDEATESIVRVALKERIDFAIVPCCVFSKKFPKRKQADGCSEVKRFEDFLRFLKDLVPGGVITDTLPIAGKNTVLFKRFSDT